MWNRRSRIHADLILIGSILLIGLLLYGIIEYGIKRQGNVVVISLDNEVYEEVNLDNNQEISIKENGSTNIIVIRDKKVYMKDATCKNHICVNHNPISKVGETIVCLPNKILIEIVEDSD